MGNFSSHTNQTNQPKVAEAEYTQQLQGHTSQFSCYGYGPDTGYQTPAGAQPHTAQRTTSQPFTCACKLDRIRQEEFSRLEAEGTSGAGSLGSSDRERTVYLDHAGSALYSERQLEGVFQELRAVLLSNPHRYVRCSVLSAPGKCLQQRTQHVWTGLSTREMYARNVHKSSACASEA